MKLVQLKRQGGDGPAEVVAAVGPMADADADAYAARLAQEVEQHTGLGLSVATTSVVSTSGGTAEPPAEPAELLRALLAIENDTRDRSHELPDRGDGG